MTEILKIKWTKSSTYYTRPNGSIETLISTIKDLCKTLHPIIKSLMNLNRFTFTFIIIINVTDIRNISFLNNIVSMFLCLVKVNYFETKLTTLLFIIF